MPTLTAVDAAKALRPRLKSAFPGVKFSVKSAWGDVDVAWTDGPDRIAVNAVVVTAVLTGFHGRVNLARSFSAAVTARATAAWEQSAGRPAPALYDNVRAVEVDGYRVPAGTFYYQLNLIASRMIGA